MKLLQHIYDELNDQDEIAIMEKYGNMAKYHTGVLTSKITSFSFLQTAKY